MDKTSIKTLFVVAIMAITIVFMFSDYNKTYVGDVLGYKQPLPTPTLPSLTALECIKIEKAGVIVCPNLLTPSWIQNTNDFPVVILKIVRETLLQYTHTEWKKIFSANEQQNDIMRAGDQFYIFKDKQFVGLIEPYQSLNKNHSHDNQVYYYERVR